MKDFDKILKNIIIPEFKNEENCINLEERLKTEIQNVENMKNQKIKTPHILRYALSAALFIGLIISSTIIFFHDNNNLKLTVISMSGDVKFELENGKEIKKSDSYIIAKGFSIKTSPGSNLKVIIGNGYDISINENTELRFVEAEVNGKNENCRIFMDKGRAEYSVKLPLVTSVFQVQTDISEYTVKGTRFTVNVKKNESDELKVDEGKVKVHTIYIRTDPDVINNIDKKLKEKILSIIDNERIIEKNKSIIIRYKEIKSINDELMEKVYHKMKNNESIDDESLKTIIESTDNIIKLQNNMMQSDNADISGNDDKIESKNKKHELKKTKVKLDMPLNELNTSVTNGGNYIFVSNDENNTVNCIDIVKKIILWKFSDPDMKTISTPAIYHDKEVIFCSPDYLFSLNDFGKIKYKKKIDNGPVYWSSPVSDGNSIYVPTSKTIFAYNGKEFSILENIPESFGIIYALYFQNQIFFNDLNKKTISIYNLSKKKITYEISLDNRSFMPPLVNGKIIFIIDNYGTAYKYDSSNMNASLLKLSIISGVMSNLIVSNQQLFYVDNGGRFCSIDINTFDKSNVLSIVDNGNNKDKYLVKKLLMDKNKIYYCAENGYLFCYEISSGKTEFYKTGQNIMLTGSPVVYDDAVYFFDTNGNMYSFD